MGIVEPAAVSGLYEDFPHELALIPVKIGVPIYGPFWPPEAKVSPDVAVARRGRTVFVAVDGFCEGLARRPLPM